MFLFSSRIKRMIKTNGQSFLALGVQVQTLFCPWCPKPPEVNGTGVVYVRPGVVVAPTASPNKVVRLVLLNLALSFPQAHNSAPFGRHPPGYKNRNVQSITLDGKSSVAARVRVAVRKYPLRAHVPKCVRAPPRRRNPAM